ncbi:transposase [Halosquirtibacter laminarini]|uniref:Transposase n=1 Tax=Halosquirtibacter laminarini TaxID=3374600 RepID=A0AC61NDD2_9BACT|nr:transposase [Prolixibacteraceae bacterium]
MKKEESTNLNYFLMKTLINNLLQEVVACYSSLKTNGEKNQTLRAKVLFSLYPDIEKAYNLTHELRMIFSQTQEKSIAYTKLARGFNEVEISGFTTYSKNSNTIYSHYSEIVNFFDNRSTNASA